VRDIILNMERFNVNKSNEAECKEQYLVTILNRFAVLENLEDSVCISRAWETVTM
jgi:hypothetical protein